MVLGIVSQDSLALIMLKNITRSKFDVGTGAVPAADVGVPLNEQTNNN